VDCSYLEEPLRMLSLGLKYAHVNLSKDTLKVVLLLIVLWTPLVHLFPCHVKMKKEEKIML
jgi:hypothetical protein